MLKIKQTVFAIWLTALSALLMSSVQFAEKVNAAEAQLVSGETALTEQERRGKAFYLRGVTADGEEAIAVLNEIEVPAATVTCAGCHGADGLGKTEGGITAGNLRWEHLTKNYGHSHDGNRQHDPFTNGSFVRAVTAGIDPSGNPLAVAMPRYKLKAADMADLIAYLKRIGTDRDPGLSDASVVIGTMFPSTGVQDEIGQAMREVLAAYFAEINDRGGIYNRRLELKVVETDEADATASLRLVPEGVFALVSGLSSGPTGDISKAVNSNAIPWVGFSTPYTQNESPLNRYLFYLHSGFGDQARALANFVVRGPEDAKGKVAIIRPLDGSGEDIVRGVREQLRKNGLTDAEITEYDGQKIDAVKLAAELRQKDVKAVFFFGKAGDEKELIGRLDTLGHRPTILLLGSLAAKDLLDAVPNGFAGKVFLAYPSVPSDLTEGGLAEYRALVEKYKIKVRYTTAQMGALASGKILVEALQRSGREVSREKLVTALEGLYEFKTAMTPQITYGPNRRKGSTGAYLVSISPERKTFVPVSGWIKAN